MGAPICPACKAANDEKAAYCDQCGQHLRPAEAPSEGGCPACGGAVESDGEGNGVCSGCGLALVATPDESCGSGCGADAGTPVRLAAAILQKTRAGMELEQAVSEACHEVLKTPAAPSDSSGVPAGAHPCPLCGVENPAEAQNCTGCGIWFEKLRAPAPCPRCERQVPVSGACSCGAILTLPGLMRYIEPAVRCVCLRCKQPYAVVKPECPDCGAGMVSADRLKAFAAAAA